MTDQIDTSFNKGKLCYNASIKKHGIIIGYFRGNNANKMRYKVRLYDPGTRQVGKTTDWNEEKVEVINAR